MHGETIKTADLFLSMSCERGNALHGHTNVESDINHISQVSSGVLKQFSRANNFIFTSHVLQ